MIEQLPLSCVYWNSGGTAPSAGCRLLKLTPGRHRLRVRAKGFAERSLALLPTQRGALSVVLTQTTDEAELLFQQAEEMREKGNAAGAVDLYRQALKLRARYAAAHLGLARSYQRTTVFPAFSLFDNVWTAAFATGRSSDA